jgi:hypothetical protein
MITSDGSGEERSVIAVVLRRVVSTLLAGVLVFSPAFPFRGDTGLTA